MPITEYVPVESVWTHREAPMSLEDAGPAVRIMASNGRPGEFVFQVRAMGEVVSVRLSPDTVAELHRHAMAVQR